MLGVDVRLHLSRGTSSGTAMVQNDDDLLAISGSCRASHWCVAVLVCHSRLELVWSGSGTNHLSAI